MTARPIRTAAELQGRARQLIDAALAEGEAGRLDADVFAMIKLGMAKRVGALRGAWRGKSGGGR